MFMKLYQILLLIQLKKCQDICQCYMKSHDFPFFSNRQSVPVTEILKEILTQGVIQKPLKTVIAKLWN